MRQSFREYLTPANLISALALLVSVISLVVTYRLTQIEGVRVKKEQLRTILSGLLDVRTEFRKALETGEKPYYDLYHERRQVFFEAADDIIGQIPGRVSWAEYNTLAKQALLDDNFDRAFAFLDLAYVNATSLRSRVYSLTGLGHSHFLESPYRDFEKGRDYFRKALELLEQTRDAYYLPIIANTYETWAEAEYEAGFAQEALSKLARAEKYLLDMPAGAEAREFRLKRVREAVSATKAASAPK